MLTTGNLTKAVITSTVLFASTLPNIANSQASVEFRGEIQDTCGFGAMEAGLLAPSSNNTALSTINNTGTPASLAITTSETTSISFTALEMTENPTSYTEGSATMNFKVSDSNGTSTSWSADAKSILVASPGTTLTVDVDVVDTNGFVPGPYALVTYATCASDPITS